MKNSQIHEGFDRKDVRDFLSMSLVKNFELETSNQKLTSTYDKENPMNWIVKDAEYEVEFHQRKLEYLRDKAAIVNLIKTNGWKEFDVSDFTSKDSPFKLHMSFIGTEVEFNSFKEKLNN